MENSRLQDIVRKIITNKSCNPKLTELLMNWFLSSEQTNDQMLFDIWEDMPTDENKEQREMILKKLHREIRQTRERQTIWRGVRRTIAIAASVAIFFFCGYALSTHLHSTPKEYHLATSKGSKGEFKLPDGTKIWLNSDAYLVYNNNFGDENRSVKLIQGEVFFDVVKDTKHPFVVSMDNLNVTVLGTKFNARNSLKYAIEEVVLIEGSVAISGDGITPTTLKPNERYTYFYNQESHIVDIVVANNYSTWFNKTLTFENETLNNILLSLERWYDINIEVSPEIDIQNSISLSTRYEPIEYIIRVISQICKFRYTISEDTVKLYTAEPN